LPAIGQAEFTKALSAMEPETLVKIARINILSFQCGLNPPADSRWPTLMCRMNQGLDLTSRATASASSITAMA
jgi:hypothetical protein